MRRRMLSTVVAGMLLAVASIVDVAVLQPAPPALAATQLSCDAIYAQQGAGARNIWAVDQNTGQVTSAGQISPSESSTLNFNALGMDDINGDGLADLVIGILPLSNNGRSIYKYDPVTGATTKLGNGVAGATVTHGDINPATGHYYYGGFANGQLQVYGFNTTTQTSMGLVAQGSVPSGNNGGNGDWAFDSQGNLYVVGGVNGANIVSVVKQKLPTSAGSPITITGTKLADISTPADKPLNGIAFSSTGYLFVAGVDQIFKVNPPTGAVVSTMPMSQASSVDMASCASPSTITVQKDFPEGRHTGGDQVTLSVTGGGITVGNTATTSGNESGVQAAEAGPVIVLAGQTYTVSESGSGTGSPKYDSSWKCVDLTSGRSLAQGAGTTGSFVMPDGGPKGISAVCTFTNRANLPALELEKSADKDALVAGETITYSFTATNTGNVALADVHITEGSFTGSGALSDITCPAEVDSLAPTQSAICTATYKVTQADVDRGSIHNTATATGTPPSGGPVTSPQSAVAIPGSHDPGLSIVKSADKTDLVLGETITYSFVVTNTGNVTLSDISIAEGTFTGSGDLSDITCADGAASLAPGAQVTCTASYEVTQADVDRGSIQNSATASGTPPGGDGPVATDPSQVRIPQDPAPKLELLKTADTDDDVEVGDTITYSFEVKNTGNVTLTDVAVNEGEFSGSGDLSDLECEPGIASMLPGATARCTATYEVTQADVDRGSITNSATATGTPPGDGGPVTSDRSEASVFSKPAPALALVKTADPAKDAEAGEVVTYSFKITNTGNVTLTDVGVTEGDFSGSGDLSAIVCPDGAESLAPGDSVTCTATYRVTQADVDRGSIVNTATAKGTPPTGDPVSSEPSEVKIPQDPRPGIKLTKSADNLNPTVGETVTYSFAVENTGNVTLTNVTVDEGAFTGSGKMSAMDCPDTTVDPGRTIICTATYEVTQADVDSGQIKNSATATGTPPSGDPVTSDPSEVTLPQPATPGISIVKSADRSGLVAGDTVTYSFAVKNTGNVTLTGIKVNEGDFTGSGSLSAVDCPDTALAPGEIAICTATYEVTQADVDRGSVENSATATGTPPGGSDPITSDPSEVALRQTPDPGLSLKKTVNKTDLVAGESLTYSFHVANTGNVTLTGISVEEGEFTGSGKLSAIECPTTTLAPGDATTCTATYTVTQADVDRGSLHNSATATGTPPGGGDPVASDPSEVTIPQEPKPGLELVKTADRKTTTRVGQIITYSFAVSNVGNVTLTNVQVNEGDFSGAGKKPTVVCPAPSTLAPGASITCTATYRVVAADLTGKPLTNVATAAAIAPGGKDPVLSPPSTVNIKTVSSSRSDLPVTGGVSAPGLVLLGTLLLLAGIGVIRTRRRHRLS